MDAERLKSVLDALEIEFAQYDPALTALIVAYTQARDTPAQDLSAQIEAARAALAEILLSAPSNDFPPSRRHILDRLGASEWFGTIASAKIEDMSRSSTTGLAGVVTRLEQFKASATTFRQSAALIREGMESLAIEEPPLSPGDYEVGVIIPASLVDAKLGQLNEQLAKWNNILRTFSEVAGEEGREIAVRGLATGAYELFAVCGAVTAGMLATTLERLTAWYKTILEIRLLRKRLEDLKVPAAETKEVKKHEEKVLTDGISLLVSELIKQATKTSTARTKPEMTTQLTVSIRQIARFVDAGGEVEVTPPVVEPGELLPEPAVDEAADPKVTQQLLKDREQAEKITAARVEQWRRLRAQGASIAKLPVRSEPILQLPEAADEAPPPKSKGKD